MPELLDQIRAIVGEKNILSGDQLSGRSAGYWRGGDLQALALVRPATTEEVSRILVLCNEASQSVVAVGGATGLAEAHQTDETEIALSLERMTAIEPVDIGSRTITVEAGAILQNVQEAAAEENLMFGLDLGARASCTIGGTIATNAGGNRVIRYGMMRDLTLGVEAVLADGTIVSSMSGFLKNNTGYDIRQMFVGAEGTLGVITKAVLRLHEAPSSMGTALLCIPSWDALLKVLRKLDRAMGGGLVAFEALWRDFYEFNTSEHAEADKPLETETDYYVILETFEFGDDPDSSRLEDLLGTLIEDELVIDGLITKSEDERRRIWDIRESFEAETKLYDGSMSYDISLPQSDMENYTNRLKQAIAIRWPDGIVYTYGHVGDGNLHYSIVNIDWNAHEAVDGVVYELLKDYGGSISAEHGIGLEKKQWLGISRSEAEMNIMRGIKKTLDPKGILNPGKLFDMND
ncbi:MAG: FAD-binding oxidoreductase [Rhodospirillales bacterium]|nr:FAD-binding oxidoreductase [Rhodospirillales bacterium]